MILKGSQRGNGQNLAAHLMRLDDNDHVTLYQLRGVTADDLHGAFKEIEAVSRGTKCQQYLFSLSLSPPEGANLNGAAFEDAVDRIERKLGLDGQPRAIVIHEKEGRRHAHCVWSRIDAGTMTARQMSFFKQKLVGVSRDLYLENGWQMPRGLDNAAERDPTNFSLAEWQQAKRQGVDPRWLKQALQTCWGRADNLAAFQNALQDRGFFLAKGDRRGFVVLDHTGDVWSLPRMLNLKTKDVQARLGDGANLANVSDTRKLIGQRMTPAIRRHIAETRERFSERSARLGQAKEAMTKEHRQARLELDHRLKREWEAETRARAARLPRGLAGLWHRLTGKYQEVRRQNELDALRDLQRKDAQRQEQVRAQQEQRAKLQVEFRELRRRQAEQLLELRADIGRYLKFSRGAQVQAPARAQERGLGLER